MKKSSKYILITAFMVWHILPYLLQIVILQATKHSISDLVYLLCQGIGLVGLLGLGYIALKKKGISKRTELLFIGLYFIAFILVRLAIRGPITRIDNITLRMVLGLVLFVIAIFLLASALMRGLCKINVTMVIVGLVILYFMSNTVISVVFEIVHLSLGKSVLTQLFCMVLCSMLEGIIFNKSFDYVINKEPEKEFKEEKYKVKFLPALVVSGICVISILGMIPGIRPATWLVGEIEILLDTSSKYFKQGDLGKAIENYDKALDYVNVLRYVCDNEYEYRRLRETVNLKEVMELKYLVWEKEEKYYDIENYYFNVKNDINIGIPLLDYYSDLKKEIDNENLFNRLYGENIKDITKQMIAENQFTNPTFSVKDIENKGKYFERKFEKYVITEDFLNVLQTMEQIGKNEEITKDNMTTLLKCANNQPNNLYIQFITVACGTTYKDDNANHYEGTSGCINRIIDIYKENEETIETESEEVYLWAIHNLIKIGYYERALNLLTEIEENEETIVIAAFCYHSLGLNKQCIEMADKLAEDNYYGIYYRALSKIHEGENNEALDEMMKLCKVMESSTDKKKDIEILLYVLIQKAVLSDSVSVYKYGFYKPDLEELNNDILKHYMDAIYYCYEKIDYVEAEKAIDRVLELDNELIQALYLKGVIHMETHKYDEAKECLETVLEENPNNVAALRVLLDVYDLMGNYEAAYECSLKIKRIVPNTDHSFDIYGIGYHNNRLLLQLEKELGVAE